MILGLSQERVPRGQVGNRLRLRPQALRHLEIPQLADFCGCVGALLERFQILDGRIAVVTSLQCMNKREVPILGHPTASERTEDQESKKRQRAPVEHKPIRYEKTPPM